MMNSNYLQLEFSVEQFGKAEVSQFAFVGEHNQLSFVRID